MAAASIVVPRVRKAHETLTEAGWSGKKMPRSIFDSGLALYLDVAGNHLLRHIAAGEALGLWVRSDGGTRRGTIRILSSALPVGSEPSPVLA
jgi:hypothetical protein